MIIAFIVGFAGFIPLGLAISAYPRSKPVEPVPSSSVSASVTFELPLITASVFGSERICTVEYSFEPAPILATDERLITTITVIIPPLYAMNEKIQIDYAYIDNSIDNTKSGSTYPVDPQIGLTDMSTNDTTQGYMFEGNRNLNLTSSNLITGTLGFFITNLPNSSKSFAIEWQITNTTSIDIPSFSQYILENETQANAVQTQHDNSVLNSLEWLIVAFIVFDLGFSFFEASEKK